MLDVVERREILEALENLPIERGTARRAPSQRTALVWVRLPHFFTLPLI
jgi:hypothetical protein